jgi:two-component system, NtrC family, sensor histidine kinase HydH
VRPAPDTRRRVARRAPRAGTGTIASAGLRLRRVLGGVERPAGGGSTRGARARIGGAGVDRPMSQTRTALILLPLVTSAALLATLLTSWASARAAQTTLARGQGDLYLDTARRLADGADPVADLDALVAEEAAEGLRCVAVFDRGGALLHVAGGCLTGEVDQLRRELYTSANDRLIEVGDRVRMVRGSGLSAVTPANRTPLLVEYEPLLSRELERGALRSLGIGGAASLALIVVAVGLYRLGSREARLQEAMERDRRLASLGEMAGVVAHEIRNPLASMKGHAQLLAERLEPGSAEHDKAQRLVREAVRLEDLTSDLLGFIRSKQLERRTVDPRQVLAEAAAEVAPERVVADLDGGPSRWSLDPVLTKQVLINLLQNAVEASPDSAPAEARALEERGDLVFEVRDRGPGIPAGEEQRIFEPFYTTRLHGTGLGLAVARRIAALHGGDIATHNHPGGGAVFRVRLPRS